MGTRRRQRGSGRRRQRRRRSGRRRQRGRRRRQRGGGYRFFAPVFNHLKRKYFPNAKRHVSEKELLEAYRPDAPVMRIGTVKPRA